MNCIGIDSFYFTTLLVYSRDHPPFVSHGFLAEFLHVPLFARASSDTQIDCNEAQTREKRFVHQFS